MKFNEFHMPSSGKSSEIILAERPAGSEKSGEASAKRLRDFITGQVSPEWLERKKKLEARIPGNRRKEEKGREQADPWLKKAIEHADDKNISDEERNRMIFSEYGHDESPEAQRLLREKILGDLGGNIENFKRKHAEWKEAYRLGDDPILLNSKEKIEELEYMKIKGKEEINLKRKQLARMRTENFFDENFKVEGVSEGDLKTNKETFCVDVDKYVEVNGDELAELNQYPEDKRAARKHILLMEFQLIVNKNGFTDVEKETVNTLFEQIVGDLEEVILYKQAYEMSAEAEIVAAEEGITQEEWEQRRQAILEEATKPKEEKPAENATPPSFTGIAVDTATTPSYKSVESVGTASGVHFREIDPKMNLYEVEFLAYKGVTGFKPKLKIVYDKQSPENINKAAFVLEYEWPDKESPRKGEPFGEKSSLVFKAEEMVVGINALVFDYVINRRLYLKVQEVAKEGPNDIINDAVMARFANRILAPDGINVPLNDEKIKRFERLMMVVLKDSPPNYDTLLKRVNKMSRLLERDDLLGYIQELLKKDSGGIWNMPNFEEMVNEIDEKSLGKISGKK